MAPIEFHVKRLRVFRNRPFVSSLDFCCFQAENALPALRTNDFEREPTAHNGSVNYYLGQARNEPKVPMFPIFIALTAIDDDNCHE